MTQIERIDYIIQKFCNGNKSEFARRLGSTSQAISQWYTRGVVGSNVLAKILVKFPEINPNWLYEEEGDLLLKPSVSNINSQVVGSNNTGSNVEINNDAQQFIDIIKTQQKQIDEALKQNAEILKQNANLQELLQKILSK